MKILQVFAIVLFAFSMSQCCPANKQTKQPSAKDALPERNTKDPKLDSLNDKKAEVAIPINN